jgi:hypothetical protein
VLTETVGDLRIWTEDATRQLYLVNNALYAALHNWGLAINGKERLRS